MISTWSIKGNKLMRNFLYRAQRNEVHVLYLFQVIGHYSKTLATTEVGIKEGVRDLIFLRLRGEANQTDFLKKKNKHRSKIFWSYEVSPI